MPSLPKLILALRIVALIEGLSWIVLIGAMIYRAQTGHHEPVSLAGRTHGSLFCGFCVFLFLCWFKAEWPLRFSVLIGLSSLIPLGFLFADPHLKRKQAAQP